MIGILLDTHGFIRDLKRSGMPEEQAEAIVESLLKIDLRHVATKEDLAALKADIFKWSVPLLIGQLLAFIALNGWMLWFFFPR